MKREMLFLAGGVILGAIGGVFGSKIYFKKKYEEIADAEILQMREYYERTIDISEDTEEDDGDINLPERGRGPLTPEKRDEIRKKLNKNWEGTTNYAGAYKRKTEEPIDDDIDDLEEDDVYDEEADNERWKRDKNKPPKIISAEAVGDLSPSVDHVLLFFYAYDETLTNEEDQVEDEDRLLGDCLHKFDFVDSDEKIIFVMNYELDTCYEIQKVNASFSDQMYDN